MPPPFAPQVGQRVGRYELKSFLRAGGPARVFMANDGAGRQVPLVVLDPASGRPEVWAAFARAVSAATAAAIPGLVPVRGVEATPSDPPYCFADAQIGWSFDRLRREPGPPAWQRKDVPIWERALQLGERMAAILADTYAATGLAHGAVIAARCVVTEHDEVRLLDFGIGELEPGEGRADDVGYRAPEQQVSRGDHRSDVYALAAVLFELTTGERPSPKIPPKLRSLVPRAPQAVDDLFARALARDPAQRFQDAAAMRAAIRELLRLGPVPVVTTAAAPVGPPQPVQLDRTGVAEPPSLPSARSEAPKQARGTQASEPRASEVEAPRSVESASEPRASGVETPRLVESRARPGARAGGAFAPILGAAGPPGPRAGVLHEPLPALEGPREPPTERLPPIARGRPFAGARYERPPGPDGVRTEVLGLASGAGAGARTEVLGGSAHPGFGERTEVLPGARPGFGDRTEVLPGSARSTALDRTEALIPPGPPTDKLLPIPQPEVEARAGALEDELATLTFRRAPARPVEADRTVLELRHLSRVIHADATLELSPSELPRPVAAPVDPDPVESPAAPANPTASPAVPAVPAAAGRPAVRWTLQRVLVAVNLGLLTAMLTGLLVLRC